MNLLSDVITYFRRIIKSPSNSTVSDNLIIDYVNRFYINDVDARVQLFDLKKVYKFQTTPGVDRYNMPLYALQTEPGSQTVSYYPVYQGFTGNCSINGIRVPFQVERETFFNAWANQTYNLYGTTKGNGTTGPYTINLPVRPGTATTTPPLNAVVRGHVDISGVIANANNLSLTTPQDPITGTSINTIIPVTSISSEVWITATSSTGANIVVADSGQFLVNNPNYGLLMNPGGAPTGNAALSGGYSTTVNTVNYLSGVANVTFPTAVPNGNAINAQCRFFACGLPRSVLYYDNALTLRAPPDRQYMVELDAYLSPAAFLATTDTVQFGYMTEYLARGAARKLLSDTENWAAFDRYEPLFFEQENLVLKRSQRQFASQRTPTLYSGGTGSGYYNMSSTGSSTG